VTHGLSRVPLCLEAKANVRGVALLSVQVAVPPKALGSRVRVRGRRGVTSRVPACRGNGPRTAACAPCSRSLRRPPGV
jgi:hypothetical protein